MSAATDKRGRHLVFIGGTSEPGGLHFHTADVAQACTSLGQRVTIVCTSVNFFAQLITDPAIRIVVVPPLKGFRQRLRAWREIARSCRGADIVFCSGALGQVHLRDLLLARLIGRRVYEISHRAWEGEWFSLVPPSLYGRLAGLLLRRLIAVSDEISDAAVRSFGFPRRKIATCLNWVRSGFAERSPKEMREARAALGVPDEVTLLCYAGRLAPEKRIDHLLHAMALLDDKTTELLLVGDGWKRTELAQLARSLGIEGRVRFAGWARDPRSLLIAADLFVLPSLNEGFPLAVIEAMACGCACLAHPMPSTLQLIEDGKNGVLANLSSDAMFATALQGAVARSRESRDALGRQAAKAIRGEYSLERRLPDVLRALDCEPGSGQVSVSSRVNGLDFVSP